MKKRTVSYSDFNAYVDFCYNNKIPYSIKRFGYSTTIETKNEHLYACTLELPKEHTDKNDKKPDLLPRNQLYFISKVKQYIDENELYKKIKPNYTDQSKIKFFDHNENISAGQVFKRPYSIDITKAYWYAAFNEGWLSQELFDEGLTMDKRIRLASLGSYAKQVDEIKFNGKSEKWMPTKEPKYPHVFFNQANTVFKVMEICKSQIFKPYFLFYWTDGIYVTCKEAADDCAKIININKFIYKVERPIKIERTPSAFLSHEIGEPKPKPYFIALYKA